MLLITIATDEDAREEFVINLRLQSFKLYSEFTWWLQKNSIRDNETMIITMV